MATIGFEEKLWQAADKLRKMFNMNMMNIYLNHLKNGR